MMALSAKEASHPTHVHPSVQIPQGSFTPALDAELKELANVMALSAKEASDTRSEVAASLYRRLLKEEVTSRRIDAAESPAKVCGCSIS